MLMQVAAISPDRVFFLDSTDGAAASRLCAQVGAMLWLQGYTDALGIPSPPERSVFDPGRGVAAADQPHDAGPSGRTRAEGCGRGAGREQLLDHAEADGCGLGAHAACGGDWTGGVQVLCVLR